MLARLVWYDWHLGMACTDSMSASTCHLDRLQRETNPINTNDWNKRWLITYVGNRRRTPIHSNQACRCRSNDRIELNRYNPRLCHNMIGWKRHIQKHSFIQSMKSVIATITLTFRSYLFYRIVRHTEYCFLYAHCFPTYNLHTKNGRKQKLITSKNNACFSLTSPMAMIVSIHSSVSIYSYESHCCVKPVTYRYVAPFEPNSQTAKNCPTGSCVHCQDYSICYTIHHNFLTGCQT